MIKMKQSAVLSLLFVCCFNFHSCASLEKEPETTKYPAASKDSANPSAPTLGQFIMGSMAPNASRDGKEARKDKERRKEAKDELNGRGFDKDSANTSNCPPCPCLQSGSPQKQHWWSQMPHMMPGGHAQGRPIEEDNHRARRSSYDDYWYGTGPANSLLSQINMGYNAQVQLRDYLSKYGPPLHVGTINEADFNYPKDFQAFNQPATSFMGVADSIVYELRGPLEVSPVGSLFPAPEGTPSAFTTIVISSGVYKLVGLQKDGLMKLDDGKNVFMADCNKQRYGGCFNLVRVQDKWGFAKFTPVVGQNYQLTGLLDVTLTDTATTTPPTTLQDGVYTIDAVTTPDKFKIRDLINAGKIFFVDCTKQQLPKTCENIKLIQLT